MIELISLLIFMSTLVFVCLLLTHIEYMMWKDWFYGKNRWEND